MNAPSFSPKLTQMLNEFEPDSAAQRELTALWQCAIRKQKYSNQHT